MRRPLQYRSRNIKVAVEMIFYWRVCDDRTYCQYLKDLYALLFDFHCHCIQMLSTSLGNSKYILHFDILSVVGKYFQTT